MNDNESPGSSQQPQNSESHTIPPPTVPPPPGGGGPPGDQKTGRTLFDVVVAVWHWMVKHPVKAIVAAVALLALLLIALRTGIVQVMDHPEHGLKVTSSLLTDMRGGPAFRQCVARAIAAEKKYVIESATMLVKLRHNDTPGGVVQRADSRIVYTLRALGDIARGDNAFFEQYHSKYRAITRWKGSQTETEGTGEGYYPQFELAAGELQTIITGAEFNTTLPLPQGRSAFNEKLPLGPDEEVWTYPNGDLSTGDYICSMTILLESEGVPLRPAKTDAALYLPASSKKGSEPKLDHGAETSSWDPKTQRGVIAGHWTNVFPGDEVGIHFKFGGN